MCPIVVPFTCIEHKTTQANLKHYTCLHGKIGSKISELEGANRHRVLIMQRNRKEKYRLWQNDVTETCEMDLLLATEDAEVLSSHGSCFRTAGKRKRGSRAIHSSLERVKPFRKRKTNNWITVIILNKESSDWTVKKQTQHSEENLCNISGSQIWWHEGCSGSHELEKERKVASWCHHQDQDAQSGVMRTARCANFLFCNWISPFTSRGCRNSVSYLLLLALR